MKHTARLGPDLAARDTIGLCVSSPSWTMSSDFCTGSCKNLCRNYQTWSSPVKKHTGQSEPNRAMCFIPNLWCSIWCRPGAMTKFLHEKSLISSHAEILLWLWPGPGPESKIRDETHGPTGARSGCSGHNRAVTRTVWAGFGPDRAVCFITGLGHVWRFLHALRKLECQTLSVKM